MDADKKAIIDQIPCEKTYIAGAQIVADKQDHGLAARRASETAGMAEAGIRLATLGNVHDCLWNTGYRLPGQTWIDDSGTQFLEGAAARFSYEVAANPCSRTTPSSPTRRPWRTRSPSSATDSGWALRAVALRFDKCPWTYRSTKANPASFEIGPPL